jgi:hypothetical protein
MWLRKFRERSVILSEVCVKKNAIFFMINFLNKCFLDYTVLKFLYPKNCFSLNYGQFNLTYHIGHPMKNINE